jgi:hypothetical protein
VSRVPTCIKRRDKGSGNLTEPTVRKVFAALDDGRTITSITDAPTAKRQGYKKMINRRHLIAFRALHPKLGDLPWKRSEENSALSRKTRLTLIRVIAPAIVRAANDIMGEIAAAVPRQLPRDLRDDAIQNIWLAVTERKLKRSEIASRAREFIRDEYKNNHNAWGPRSLDVPIYLDGNTTLLDTLASGSSGLWD